MVAVHAERECSARLLGRPEGKLCFMVALFVVPEGLYMAREQSSVDYRAIWMESEVENLCTDGDVWHLDERAIVVGSSPEEGAEAPGSAHSKASTAADDFVVCAMLRADRYNFLSYD